MNALYEQHLHLIIPIVGFAAATLVSVTAVCRRKLPTALAFVGVQLVLISRVVHGFGWVSCGTNASRAFALGANIGAAACALGGILALFALNTRR